MLVLTRKVGETVVFAGSISVTVVAIQGDRVRVGITAPANVPVDREEIHRRKELQRNDLRAAPLAPGDPTPFPLLRRARAGPLPLTGKTSMPTPKKRYALTKENVDRAPAQGGVYALFKRAELIFFGQALGGLETIRSCLQGYQTANEGVATRGATHYRRHCADPAAREQALLRAYAGAHAGRLPRCNEATPDQGADEHEPILSEPGNRGQGEPGDAPLPPEMKWSPKRGEGTVSNPDF